jgi:16S rRNA (cytidine1402-2'-O)-methyltransferase
MSNQNGKLYVVATPIGNLSDISYRAVEVLQTVDLIAAEDTRHVRQLLQHYGISNKLTSLHQHNEQHASLLLIEKMQQGLSIALVSDAGTPLISDPGLPLIKLAKASGITVSPIPGACALITAISASGLPVHRFMFEGFLPRTSSARKTFFRNKLDCPCTWVVFESSHRILATIKDITEILPGERTIVIARELTKLYETIVNTTVDEALEIFAQDKNMQRGEFVILIAGAEPTKNQNDISPEQEKLLTVLLKECSIKSAVAMAVEITGTRKKILYQAALKLSNRIK